MNVSKLQKMFGVFIPRLSVSVDVSVWVHVSVLYFDHATNQTEVEAGSWYDGHACYPSLMLPTCLCDRAARNRKHVLVHKSRSLNEYILCSRDQ